jgi:ribosome-binding protein aMBF1 (putative translation factor)
MIELFLTEVNSPTRWLCTVCGGLTEKDQLVCENERVTILVCEQCLKDGQDKIDERLKARVAELRDDAADLKTLIGNLNLPTFEEWKRVTAEYEAERLRRARPLQVVRSVDHDDDDDDDGDETF